MEFGIGLVVTSIFWLITWIWLLVIAFKENIWWGFGNFLLYPLLSIVFVILHFKKAWLPFTLSIIAMIVFYASVFSAIPEGSMDTFGKQMELQQKLERGEITQEQAEAETRKMIEAMMQGKKYESAPTTAPQAAPEVSDDTLEKARESHRKAREQWNKQWKANQQKKEYKELAYIPVKVDDAKKYLHKNIRITTTSGQVREGSLLEVSLATLTVGREDSSGTFSYDIKKGTIAKMEVEDWITVPVPK